MGSAPSKGRQSSAKRSEALDAEWMDSTHEIDSSEGNKSPPKDTNSSNGNKSPPKDTNSSNGNKSSPKDTNSSNGNKSSPKDTNSSNGNKSPPKENDSSKANLLQEIRQFGSSKKKTESSEDVPKAKRKSHGKTVFNENSAVDKEPLQQEETKGGNDEIKAGIFATGDILDLTRALNGERRTSKGDCMEPIKSLTELYKIHEPNDYDHLSKDLLRLERRFKQVGFWSNPSLARENIAEVINALIESGTADKIYETTLSILTKKWNKDKNTGENNVLTLTITEQKILSKAITLLINMSDQSEALAIKICEKPDFLEAMTEFLLLSGLFSDDWDTIMGNIAQSVLGLLYNCSMSYANKQRLRVVGLIWIFKRLLDENNSDIRLTATVALAGILDEDESKYFKGEQVAISQLIKFLLKATKTNRRRCEGWSTYELAKACSRLGSSDVNKTLLVKAGALNALTMMCKTGNEMDQAEALSALWTLAFDESNQEKMVNSEEIMNLLIEMRSSKSESVKTQAENILWTLHEKLMESANPLFKQIGCEFVRKLASSDGKSERHLMISYNWGSKEIVFKLHEALVQNGFHVWIDKNEMKGSLIDCMAEGVEKADAFLMCISPRYKESKYCRAEAHYAFERDLVIVPLLMETNYHPDGWLGFIKGASKHFDFSMEEKFDRMLSALVEDLGKINKGREQITGIGHGHPVIEPVIVPVHQPVVMSSPNAFSSDGVDGGHGGGHGTPVVTVKSVESWTTQEVTEFLKNNKCFSPAFKNIDGSTLKFLKDLKKEAPEFFFNYLETKLKVKELHVLANFTKALKRL